MSSFLRKALVSEKSYLSASAGKYTFLVDKVADKKSISNAVEKIFKVHVTSVNTINYIGKKKKTKKNSGKRANFKKAILTLKPGEKIDLFEIEDKEAKKDKKQKNTKDKANVKVKE